MSGLQVVNLIYYLICTKFYTYKALEEASEGGTGGGDVQLTIGPTVRKSVLLNENDII